MTPLASSVGPSIRVQTPLLGPRSSALLARRQAALPRGVASMTPFFIARGDGAIVEDVDGNRLLDFAGGLGCLNVGHRAPAVVEAVQAQAVRFLHGCVHVTANESYVRLAEVLNERTPGTWAKRTLLVNSGAEAVENAIKIARAATGRSAVVAFEDAFHGRTLLGMSLTSKTHPYKAGFGPLATDVYRLPYAYPYRTPNAEAIDWAELCAVRFDSLFRRVVAAESVAAVVVEPVLGEGGFIVPPREYLAAIQQICRDRGILFIADEIQTGFGRTGALFASEVFGLEPDLILSGKSLGGGMPIAAVTGRQDVMDAPGAGGLGGTYGGNPLACAAALAVIDTYDALQLGDRAMALGRLFRERTHGWPSRFPLIGEIRGLGAMQAIEFVRDRRTKEPAPAETIRLLRACHERGLIVLSAGTSGNVLRLLVPLVITDAQFREGLDVLEAALETVHTRE